MQRKRRSFFQFALLRRSLPSRKVVQVERIHDLVDNKIFIIAFIFIPETQPTLHGDSRKGVSRRQCKGKDEVFFVWPIPYYIYAREGQPLRGPTPSKQRALKAQQFRAWGNAPGTHPPVYCRAVGAKTMQAERHEFARMVEAQPVFYKSSRRRYRCKYTNDRSRVCLSNRNHGYCSC